MRKLAPLAILTVALDILILFICVSHLPSIAARARVPFEVSEDRGCVLVSSILNAQAGKDLKVGDEITAWNYQPVRDSEFLEFSADRESTGSSVNIGVRTDANSSSALIKLILYDS